MSDIMKITLIVDNHTTFYDIEKHQKISADNLKPGTLISGLYFEYNTNGIMPLEFFVESVEPISVLKGYFVDVTDLDGNPITFIPVSENNLLTGLFLFDDKFKLMHIDKIKDTVKTESVGLLDNVQKTSKVNLTGYDLNDIEDIYSIVNGFKKITLKFLNLKQEYLPFVTALNDKNTVFSLTAELS